MPRQNVENTMALDVGASLDKRVFDASGISRNSKGVQYGPIVDAMSSCVRDAVRTLP